MRGVRPPFRSGWSQASHGASRARACAHRRVGLVVVDLVIDFIDREPMQAQVHRELRAARRARTCARYSSRVIVAAVPASTSAPRRSISASHACAASELARGAVRDEAEQAIDRPVRARERDEGAAHVVTAALHPLARRCAGVPRSAPINGRARSSADSPTRARCARARRGGAHRWRDRRPSRARSGDIAARRTQASASARSRAPRHGSPRIRRGTRRHRADARARRRDSDRRACRADSSPR